MELEQVAYGQRVRVDVPGLGDHGQVGTVKKVQQGRIYVQLDWDERRLHPVWFYPADLERMIDEPQRAS